MDRIYCYFTSLWENFCPVSCWGSSSSTPDQTEPSESSHKHDIPVTKPAQALVSEEGNRPAQSTVNSHSVPQIPSQYSISLNDTEEIAEVEKIYINVKCAGKIMKVDVFPLEKISVLLKEACDRAEKKPERMTLVYDGKHLDVNETVRHYGLRGGTTVNMIHKS
ncbi:hypothetical protein R3I93_001094 [Phoxinus phoxinus]|uniref:Ubiquitin-like domain-containing protein n=1 Tax=Phoxinus phoxinus TaxID=58324 RepID=A0AAN9HIU9_9TELE